MWETLGTTPHKKFRCTFQPSFQSTEGNRCSIGYESPHPSVNIFKSLMNDSKHLFSSLSIKKIKMRNSNIETISLISSMKQNDLTTSLLLLKAHVEYTDRTELWRGNTGRCSFFIIKNKGKSVFLSHFLAVGQ